MRNEDKIFTLHHIYYVFHLHILCVLPKEIFTVFVSSATVGQGISISQNRKSLISNIRSFTFSPRYVKVTDKTIILRIF